MISRFSTTARSGMANAVSDTVRAVKSTATTYKESVSTAAKEGVAAAKEVPKGNEPGMRYQNGFLAGAVVCFFGGAAYMMSHNAEKSMHQEDVTALANHKVDPADPVAVINSTAVKGVAKSGLMEAQDRLQKP